MSNIELMEKLWKQITNQQELINKMFEQIKDKDEIIRILVKEKEIFELELRKLKSGS